MHTYKHTDTIIHKHTHTQTQINTDKKKVFKPEGIKKCDTQIKCGI